MKVQSSIKIKLTRHEQDHLSQAASIIDEICAKMHYLEYDPDFPYTTEELSNANQVTWRILDICETEEE